MIARLGQVIYWAACGVAALATIGAIAFAFSNADHAPAIIFVIFAVIAWLIGRAALYVMAGR